ncbi:MFS transporter [Desulfolithobacter dissulfuricans]|uniref:MFS transporter n=1 Tax=Desulfolithobacter dissulfuricans TaxID=2795293 RepID=A0A915XHP8_9BACT|nr:MFS transporter [Desulfolithobacter dissulfuricans]BCO08914.1 MFS transporter [Desulfolithobacter dissulfuricans]
MNHSDRKILSVTCYGHFLSHCNMLVFPAILLPLSSRLGLGMAETLELGFWMYLLFGITALPWGLLSDRFGARPLLALFYVGAGVSALASGFFIDDPQILRWTLAGIGLFSGIYHPAGLGWIACCVSRTSTGMAYNGMFGNFGLATGPLLAGLINWLWGAQAVYVAVGLLNLAGIVFLVQVRTESQKKQTSHNSTNSSASWLGFGVLLVAMMLGGIVYRGTTVTLPSLFELKGQGIYTTLSSLLPGTLSGNVVATVITSGLYLVGMLGQFAGGRVGERFDLRRGYLAFHLVTIPLAFVIGRVTDVPLVLLATAHSFFLLGMQPIENTLVARLTPPGLHSSAYGMKFVLTFGIGALAVKLVHLVESSRGLAAVYPVLGLVSILLVLTIGVLIRATPQLSPSRHG